MMRTVVQAFTLLLVTLALLVLAPFLAIVAPNTNTSLPRGKDGHQDDRNLNNSRGRAHTDQRTGACCNNSNGFTAQMYLPVAQQLNC